MVPASPLEAARIDGANDWQIFRYVVFPYIQQTLLVAGHLPPDRQHQGLPADLRADRRRARATSRRSTNYYAYRQAFTFSLWGYGSAIATLMVIGHLRPELGRSTG